MRLALLLVLFSSGLARAQIVRPMGETPGDLGPVVPTSPEPTGPQTAPGHRARFSLFSAGRGGPLFAFSQIVDGLVVGGLIGARLASEAASPLALPQGAYLGALIGGVGLGGLGALLQYVQPIGVVAAGATSLGLAVGALAGLGLATLLDAAVQGLPAVLPGVLALAGSQVGALVPLALSWAAEDLDPSALALMGAGSSWAFALALFVNLAAGVPLAAPALLIAPAAGMAVGGLVAALARVSIATILQYTLLPLGGGLAAFLLSGVLGAPLQVGAGAALATATVTVLVTALVSFATTAPAPPATVSLVPTLTVVAAGRDAKELALGPAALVRF